MEKENQKLGYRDTSYYNGEFPINKSYLVTKHIIVSTTWRISDFTETKENYSRRKWNDNITRHVSRLTK